MQAARAQYCLGTRLRRHMIEGEATRVLSYSLQFIVVPIVAMFLQRLSLLVISLSLVASPTNSAAADLLNGTVYYHE